MLIISTTFLHRTTWLPRGCGAGAHRRSSCPATWTCPPRI